MRLAEVLARRWGLADVAVVPHHGGMNSATWFVGRRYVAKAVPLSRRRAFEAGLAVAAALEPHLPAGAPVPASDGAVVVEVGDDALALLRLVPGVPVTDPILIGTTLARMHHALRDVTVTGEDRFHWVEPDAPHLGIRPWIRPAVAAAVAALDTRGMTSGLLHNDPAPEAFRHDRASGVCGVIDWSAAIRGPLLYDLASAVMYAGPGVIEAYLERGPLPRAEVDGGLAAMTRFRWAVQADYFARRLATGDLTGIAGAAENEKGLADARAGLGA